METLQTIQDILFYTLLGTVCLTVALAWCEDVLEMK